MVTRGAQVGGRALVRRTRRDAANNAALSCPRLHRPLAIGLSPGLQTVPSLCAETAESKLVPSPVTLLRAARLRDDTDEVHSQAPLPRSRNAPRTAPLLFSRLRLPCIEPLDLAEEWPSGPGLRLRDQRREGPLSWTKTKVRRAGGAHALPRRSRPARPRLSPSSRASRGGWASATGPNLQRPAVGHAMGCERCGGGSVARPGAQWEPTGRHGDSAGSASALPLVWRGPGAECGGSGGLAQTRRAPGAC